MPELPEVETTLRGIAPYIIHQTICNVVIRQKSLRFAIPNDFKKTIINQSILAIKRRAKYLLLYVEKGAILIHLGMSGHLRLLTSEQELKKHDHVDFVFANNFVLRFNDPRRFGAILFAKNEPLTHRLLKNLGVEPLTPNFNTNFLFSITAKRKTAIKSLIMDAHVVVGVGNIYAAEALFSSRIHPNTPANRLSQEQLALLVKHIKRILRLAIKRGGTTLKDFLKSDGKPGYFSHQLKVYGRHKLPCFTCGTLLENITIGNRNTVFCPNCQKG